MFLFFNYSIILEDLFTKNPTIIYEIWLIKFLCKEKKNYHEMIIRNQNVIN